jgi:hypothetical protein
VPVLPSLCSNAPPCLLSLSFCLMPVPWQEI